MGLCHNKLPGEWYGPHAIAIMMKVKIIKISKNFQDLNKLYRPFNDFQVCVFHDGNIYFDKIKKLAFQNCVQDNEVDRPRPYLVKSAQSKQQYDRTSKNSTNSNIEFVFKDYLQKIGHLKAYKQNNRGGYSIQTKTE